MNLTRFICVRPGQQQNGVWQAWFYDANGCELCGAYYAYVRRK
jgi:hypothetical protein